MTIRSNRSLDQCIAALESGTTKDTLFGAIGIKARTIVCKRIGTRFRLREKRSYGNSFAPFFYGNFVPVEGGTEVIGEFRMQPLVTIGITIWFGLLALIGAVMVISAVRQLVVKGASPNIMALIGGPFLMAALGYGLLRFSWWLARYEKVRISQFIEATFGEQEPWQMSLATASPSSGADTNSPEPIMWRAVMFFSVLGLISLVGGVSGIASFQSTYSSSAQAHAAITRFDSVLGQGFAVVDGVFLLLMAYGVAKRRRLCWKMGFLVFALAAFSSFYGILGRHHHAGDPPPIMILSILAVGAYWVTWWYRKRDYFIE